MTPPFVLVDAALRGGVVALWLLLVAVTWRGPTRSAPVRVGTALALGLVVQTVSSTPAIEASVPSIWQAPLVGISVGNAVLFWIFVQALFDDDFRLRRRHVVAWLAVVTLGTVNGLTGWHDEGGAARVALFAQRGAPLLFAVLSIGVAASSWQADLVERRRALRSFIVVTGVLYTIGLLALRAASSGRLDGPGATLDVAAQAVMASVIAVGLLRAAPSPLSPETRGTSPVSALPAPPSSATARDTNAERDDPPASTDPEEDRLAEALLRAMTVDRAYRVEGLTVAGLASRLGLPEYRLRQLINRRLGHRNFNAFVNGYRIDEARALLDDPAGRAVPILTIALDVGFQSIGPFNRAFKAMVGATPTEFRQRHRTDS